MRKHKFITAVTYIFAMIALISIGFSSWSIQFSGEIDPVGIEGSVTADRIVKTDEYLVFNTAKGNGNGIELFEYNNEGDLGFVNYEDYTPTDSTESIKKPVFDKYNAKIKLYFIIKGNQNDKYSAFSTENFSVNIAISSPAITNVANVTCTAERAISGSNITTIEGTGTSANGVASCVFNLAKPGGTDESLEIIISLNVGQVVSFIEAVSANGHQFTFNVSLKDAA